MTAGMALLCGWSPLAQAVTKEVISSLNLELYASSGSEDINNEFFTLKMLSEIGDDFLKLTALF